jgi:hypothetical protein
MCGQGSFDEVILPYSMNISTPAAPMATTTSGYMGPPRRCG